MKSINGNNKTERLVNKAAKYLNLTLKPKSNKYWSVEEESLDQSHFIVTSNSIKKINTKYGQCFKITPLNSKNEKSYFVPIYKAMHITYWSSNVYLIKANDKDVAELLDLAKGFDDIMLAKDYSTNVNGIIVDKNAFSTSIN